MARTPGSAGMRTRSFSSVPTNEVLSTTPWPSRGQPSASGASLTATSSGRNSTCTRRASRTSSACPFRGNSTGPTRTPVGVVDPTIRFALPRKEATNSVRGWR
jgi:hypothetical protein